MRYVVETYGAASAVSSADMRAILGEEAERRGLQYVGTVRLPDDEVAFHVFESQDRGSLVDLLVDARVAYNRISATAAADDVRAVLGGDE